MKKRNLIALGASLVLALGLHAQTAAITNGLINWKGSEITNESHEGTIAISKGALNFDGATLTGGSFTVDMNSIVCTDLSKKYAARLVGHLKSDDFFSVESHPTALLSIISSESIAEGKWLVSGELTIKTFTHPVEFEMLNSKYDAW